MAQYHDNQYKEEFYPSNYTLDPNSAQHLQYQQQQFGYDYNQQTTQHWEQEQQGGYDMTGYTSPPVDYTQGYQGEVMEIDPSPGSLGQMTPGGPVTYGNSSEGFTGFEDELPLLEELGIDFSMIKENTLSVLNPLQEANVNTLRNTDLAGPLIFCLLFGGVLLLAGKVHFGYIYGVGLLGCGALYAVLNLMSTEGVSVGCVVSVLGYCLLPMVLLSAISVVLSLQGILGIILAVVIICWCSYSASKLFVSALGIQSTQLLVAYPCALLYGVFALLTVF